MEDAVWKALWATLVGRWLIRGPRLCPSMAWEMLSRGFQDLKALLLVIWVELIGISLWPVLGWVLGSQDRTPYFAQSSISRLATNLTIEWVREYSDFLRTTCQFIFHLYFIAPSTHVKAFSSVSPRMSALGGTMPIVYHDDTEIQKWQQWWWRFRADNSPSGIARSSGESWHVGTASGFRGSSSLAYAACAIVWWLEDIFACPLDHWYAVAAEAASAVD